MVWHTPDGVLQMAQNDTCTRCHEMRNPMIWDLQRAKLQQGGYRAKEAREPEPARLIPAIEASDDPFSGPTTIRGKRPPTDPA